MFRRVLVTLSLAATLGLAIGACTNSPGSAASQDPGLSPDSAATEAPSTAPMDSPQSSAY